MTESYKCPSVHVTKKKTTGATSPEYRSYCLTLPPVSNDLTVFSSPNLTIDASNPRNIVDSIEDILRYAQDDFRKYVSGTMALLRIPEISSYDNLDHIPIGTIPDYKTLPLQ